jgi:ATP-dependent RNA helicase DeaD
VLAPTRELALQVAEAFGRYAAHLPGLQVLPIYGGQGYGPQLAALRRGVHVVVGTPGRVIDHLDKGTLQLGHLTHLVLDEADEMLRMGFAEDVERILADTPDSKQVALFSATMPPQIRRLSKQYLHDPVEILVKTSTVTAANTRQRYVQVAGRNKVDALTRVLEVEAFEAMIIFVRTKQATQELADKLKARGFSAAAINGDMIQAQRERTVNALKEGGLDILVATDVAARGLDVDRISHVVNYDIPQDPESYVHRIGRTGRAGRSGEALLLVTPRERHLLRSIEKATRQPLTQMQMPSVEDVNSTRIAKFRDRITSSLASDEMGLFRKLVADYEQEHDVPAIDIAAAPRRRAGRRPELPAQARGPRSASAAGSRRRARQSGPRSGRASSASRQSASGHDMAMYRIRVGKRHKATPGSIVGAIANEGGLSRETSVGSTSVATTVWSSSRPTSARRPGPPSRARASPVSGIHLARDDGPPLTGRRPAGTIVRRHGRRGPGSRRGKPKGPLEEALTRPGAAHLRVQGRAALRPARRPIRPVRWASGSEQSVRRPPDSRVPAASCALRGGVDHPGPDGDAGRLVDQDERPRGAVLGVRVTQERHRWCASARARSR